jgi:threonine synthase
MKLSCVDCGNELSIKQFHYQCACGGLLDVVQDFKQMDAEHLKRLFQERLSERMSVYASGVWRYKELILPELPEEFIVTKYEGNTGLYAAEQLRKLAGVRQLWFKAQSENPSGSFKDNGMTAAVSHGRSLGYNRFACSSTGNTSSSLAMYASFAGSSSYVFVPDHHISLNKVLQTLAYGAKVITTKGNYDEGIHFLEKHHKELELYICNSINPFRIEGQKSIIYETAQYMNWNLPDWIVVPGGALSNVSALGKGLEEMKTIGLIDKVPRIALIQAEGASPFHKMVKKGFNRLQPVTHPFTKASALNIGNPPSWKKAQRTMQQSHGITCAVSDEEIMEAKALIDRSGIGCEPASASTLAGLQKLISEQKIDKDETVLCILTGNILKDTDMIKDYHLGEKSKKNYQNSVFKAELTLESISQYTCLS